MTRDFSHAMNDNPNTRRTLCARLFIQALGPHQASHYLAQCPAHSLRWCWHPKYLGAVRVLQTHWPVRACRPQKALGPKAYRWQCRQARHNPISKRQRHSTVPDPSAAVRCRVARCSVGPQRATFGPCLRRLQGLRMVQCGRRLCSKSQPMWQGLTKAQSPGPSLRLSRLLNRRLCHPLTLLWPKRPQLRVA